MCVFGANMTDYVCLCLIMRTSQIIYLCVFGENDTDYVCVFGDNISDYVCVW